MIKDLCPLPVGAVKSITRAERSSVLPLPDSKTISNPSESVFYKVPTYHSINNLYYRNITQMNGYIDLIRGVPTSSEAILDYTFTRFLTTNSEPQTFKYRRPYTRQLRDTANVLSIPQELFGENIKPSSVKIVDDSTSKTITLRDDGRGNIYDVAFSASYARREPNTNTMTLFIPGPFGLRKKKRADYKTKI